MIKLPLAVSSKSQTRVLTPKNGDIPLLKFSRDAYIARVVIEGTLKVRDHYELLIRVVGRSRFASQVPVGECHYYIFRSRYKKLKKLHKQLKRHLMKRENKFKGPCVMPGFPKCSVFDSKKQAAEKRIKQFNEYFESLFLSFGGEVIYSEPLINFFAPFQVEVLVLAKTKKIRDDYLNMVIWEIFNGKENIKSIVTASTNTSGISAHDLLTSNYNEKREMTYIFDGKPKILLWKIYNPIDYVLDEHLFRVEFINQHFSFNASVYELLSYAALVFILIDVSVVNWFEDFKEKLVTVKKHNQTSLIEVIVVNLDYVEKDYDSEIIIRTASSILKEEVIFVYKECSLTTGGGILETLDGLLKLYK